MRLFSIALALLAWPAALRASPPLVPGTYELFIQAPDGAIHQKLFVSEDEKHQLFMGVLQPCGVGFRAEPSADAKGLAVDFPDGLAIVLPGMPTLSILTLRGTPKKVPDQGPLRGFEGRMTVFVGTGTAEYPFTLTQLDNRPCGPGDLASKLVSNLVKNVDPLHVSEDLVKTGAPAIPALVAPYADPNLKWDEPLMDRFDEVFHELGSKAEGAVDPLLKVANDKSAGQERRTAALRALGAIGPAAARSAPILQKFTEMGDSPLVAQAAAEALIALRVPEAVPILLKRLEQLDKLPSTALSRRDPDLLAGLVGIPQDRANKSSRSIDEQKVSAIEDLAWLGKNGHAAGPELVKRLASGSWNERFAAALALGRVEDKEAVTPLIEALGNVEDWRLVSAAAGSLGHLRAKEAEVPLRKVAETHWYPPVREAAQHALQLFEGGEEKTWPENREAFNYDFYRTASSGSLERVVNGEKLALPVAASFRKPVTVPIEMEGKRESITLSPVGLPAMGISVEGGYLIGVFSPEPGFVGVSFHDRKGGGYSISDDILPLAFYSVGKSIRMLGLFAQGSNRYAMIYQCEPAASGHWELKPWRVLPEHEGYPMGDSKEAAALLEDGRFFVNCESGGLVSVSPDGAIRMMSRDEVIGPRPAVTEELLKHYPKGSNYEQFVADLKLAGLPAEQTPNLSEWQIGSRYDLPEGILFVSATRVASPEGGFVLSAQPALLLLGKDEKIREALLASTKDLPVSLPENTPFDQRKPEREAFLNSFADGYRQAMAGVLIPAEEANLGKAWIEACRQGYAAGQAQARKNHPDEVAQKQKEFAEMMRKAP